MTDEVVEKLLASGKFPDLGGEAFQVTVLFSDIRNFTTISENLGPHQVVEMLNTYFSRACEPILAQGGTVDKFIGDAVMAVFGAPVAYPDHARRALTAALGVAQQAREFRSWMRELRRPGIARVCHRHRPAHRRGHCRQHRLHQAPGVHRHRRHGERRLAAGVPDQGIGLDHRGQRSTIEAAPGVVTGRQETRTVKGRKEPLQVFEVLGLEGIYRLAKDDRLRLEHQDWTMVF